MVALGALIALIFSAQLVRIAYVDLRTYKIPNRSVCVLLMSWVAWVIAYEASLVIEANGSGRDANLENCLFEPFLFASDGIVGNIVFALCIGLLTVAMALVYERITGNFAMGGGDLKLICCTTLILGWVAQLEALFLACSACVVYAFARRGRCAEEPKGATSNSFQAVFRERIAFGPFLSFGYILMIWIELFSIL